MLGRTLLAVTALAATFAVPAALPDADAAVRVRDTVALSNDDNGHTVSVHSGDRIDVHLVAVRTDSEKWSWDVPAASSPEVLHRDEGHTTPDGDAVARFTATGDGTSSITAHRHCRVTRPGHLCSHLVRTWKVTVNVS
ncbi:hypothetical protein ACFP1Z_22115 [Streptomyces gamaensis]|uniref:Proteinase inhibitor I42 chagasin domain-containing protein n=1 Tax=Streptomyces gamaensis TaxID=1763542 RepID=A0ABW0Z6C3_9ACTN